MTYQTSVPAIKNNYPSSGFGDDLTIAALWLGLAQNNSTLVDQAQEYYNKFNLSAQLLDSVFNWDSVLPGIPILGAQINRNASDPRWRLSAEAYLDGLVSGNGTLASAFNLTKGSTIPASYGKVLIEQRRRIVSLPARVTIGKLESGTQHSHVVEEVCYDCDNYQQERHIPGESLLPVKANGTYLEV